MKNFEKFITEKHLLEDVVRMIQDKIARDILEIIKQGNIVDDGEFLIRRKAEHYVAIVVRNSDSEVDDENSVVQIFAMRGSSGEYLFEIDIFLNKGSFSSLSLPYSVFNTIFTKNIISRYLINKSFTIDIDRDWDHYDQSANVVYKHFKDDFDVQASLF